MVFFDEGGQVKFRLPVACDAPTASLHGLRVQIVRNEVQANSRE